MTKDTENRWGVVAAATLMAAVSGGLFFLGGPLESRRPRQQAAVVQTGARNEVVMARLWQDPLNAIQTHWNSVVTYVGERDEMPPATPLPQTIAGIARTVTSSKQELRLLDHAPRHALR